MELNRLKGSFLLLLTKEVLDFVISSFKVTELSCEYSCKS